MKRFYIVTILSGIILTNIFADVTPAVRYVKESGTGNGDSWADASGDLQAMINASADGDTIRIAAGTYKPIYTADGYVAGSNHPTGDDGRNNAFVLKEGVKIYGGFSGDADDDKRDWKTNITTLSGDFAGDDDFADLNSMDENACHVIIGIDLSANTVLDGFIITGGNADSDASISCNGQDIEQYSGGGIYNYLSSPTLTNVVITENAANISGGGMFNEESSPTLTGVIITENRVIVDGGGGGGMFNSAASPALISVAITENTAYVGGGIYNYSSSPTLTNVVIAGNTTSSDGGGMFNSTSSVPHLYNTILWGNRATNGESGVLDNDDTSSYSYCLIQGRDETDDNCIDASRVNEGGVFVDAAAGDYHLKAGSPAIDAGNDEYNDNPLDLDGKPRISGSAIDMGAYEHAIYYVKEDGDGDHSGDSWANASGDLQAMINASVSGDEILVAAGTYTPSRKANDTGTITPDDRDNAFVLKDGINIYGGFPGDASTNDDRDWKANTTTLSGDFDGDDDGFNNMSENAHHVVIDIALSANTILDGFTITGGNAETNAFISCNGQNIPKDHGGGIFSSRSSLTLTNVIITGNTATGGDGGGMFNQYSSPTLINVIIRGNTANGSGGGMYNQSSSFPKLVNVTIAGNAAADGGGMFNTGSSAPQLYNSILWDNQAVNGRSVGNDDGSPSYFYCLIQDRNDDSDGCIDALSVDGDVFVDADAGDYRLRDGCRAIDAGSDAHYQTAVDAIAVKIPGYDGFLDLDGNVRKAGEAIDPGAYEYGSVPPDVTPPVLSEGTISRTSDTEATVSFTTDEAGTAYYLVLDSDGNAPAKEAVKTDGHSLGAVEEGEANDKEVALTAGAKDIYVVVEDAAGNISDPLKIEAPAYDLTPPALSEGTAGRTGETEATVGFITDEAGTAYRFIVNGGSYAPSKEAVKEFGIFLCAVEEGAVSDTVILEGAGAKDIYVVVEDAAGNMSEALKIAVPAFIDPTPPALSAGTFSRTSETNATIGFTTSKAGTAYGFAVSGGSYAPSKEAVKEFGISLGAVATGAVSDIAVMLTAGAKDIYVVLEDAADNISNPLKIAVPAYSDVTAPILSATGASDTTQTGVTLNFTTGEAGTFYYLVYAEAGAAPTADVIKAQGAAIAKGTGMTAPAGTNTAVTVGGLTAATAYRAYVIVEDAAGNLSAVATIAFTTLAAPDRHIELSLLEDGLTVHIRNTGSVETGNLTLALSGANADVFTFSSATINSISVDGAVDITLTLRAGLPVETYTVTLTVSGEGFTPVSKEITCTPTGNDHLQSNPLKARMRSATLHVSGLTAGRMWSVYSISGMLLHHNIAGSDEADIVLPARGIYIVTSGGESIKTIY